MERRLFIRLATLATLDLLAEGCVPVVAKAISTATSTAEPKTPTPIPTRTLIATPRPIQTLAPTATFDNVRYDTIDINRPLETCPVITDIDAYYKWVNNEIQKDGAYVPFGPNTKLVPFIKLSTDPDTEGDMYGGIVLNQSTLTKNPADLPYRHLEKYIVRYKYLNYTKLIFPDLWFEPGGGAKPSLLLSSFTFDYGYGKKYTNSELKQLIEDWKANVPQYSIPPVVTGNNYANETDFLKLEIDAKNQYPDIASDVEQLTDTGDASGVAGKGIILGTSP